MHGTSVTSVAEMGQVWLKCAKSSITVPSMAELHQERQHCSANMGFQYVKQVVKSGHSSWNRVTVQVQPFQQRIWREFHLANQLHYLKYKY